MRAVRFWGWRTSAAISPETLSAFGAQFKLNSRVEGADWQEQVLDEMVLLDGGRYLLIGDTERRAGPGAFEVEWTEHYLRF